MDFAVFVWDDEFPEVPIPVAGYCCRDVFRQCFMQVFLIGPAIAVQVFASVLEGEGFGVPQQAMGAPKGQVLQLIEFLGSGGPSGGL